MLIVETIGKVRLALSHGESQRSVSRRYHLSRNTVRKVSRSGLTEFCYAARERVHRVLGAYIEYLDVELGKDALLPRKQRRTGVSFYGELREQGFTGRYDSVRRYIRGWKEAHGRSVSPAYVPLFFGRGEAFQFDFSEEVVELGGEEQHIFVAHVRLCYSRMRYCVGFHRQDLATVFSAHIRAHDFFGGLCGRGIYDNPRTIIDKIGRGKERTYNPRFLQLASHYLFDVEACTPRAGWEKGQVENQVKTNRQHVFVPRLCFSNLAELNEHLEEQMLIEARNSPHPDIADRSVFSVYEEEKAYLRKQVTSFEGYVSHERRASSLCLVHFDRNEYSLPCAYAGRCVSVRSYASVVVIAVDGKAVAQHNREFSKGRYCLDPLHYVPLLERKPGSLRNGRPFLDWELPASIRLVWDQLPAILKMDFS